MTKGWTEERRKQQAERCRRNKPWKQATGPKTPEGKEKTRLNALKHGARSRKIKKYIRLMQLNAAFVQLSHDVLLTDEYFIRFTNELKKSSKKINEKGENRKKSANELKR